MNLVIQLHLGRHTAQKLRRRPKVLSEHFASATVRGLSVNPPKAFKSVTFAVTILPFSGRTHRELFCSFE